MSKKQRAFSLVEVTLAIGVIAFGVIAIVGLMIVGVDSSKSTTDESKTNLIVQDVFNRVHASFAAPSAFSAPPYPSYPSWLPSNPLQNQSSAKYWVTYWYDGDGKYLDQSTDPAFANAITSAEYCAAVFLGPLNDSNHPPNLASGPGSPGNYPVVNNNTVNYNQDQFLQSVKIDIFWPVNSTGAVINSGSYAPNRTECFYVRKP